MSKPLGSFYQKTRAIDILITKNEDKALGRFFDVIGHSQR